MEIINLILHLDQTLASWSQWMGPWLYVVLFLVVFAETGLVVTPFLPGDSLLFAAGAISSLPGSSLDPWLIVPILMIAAFAGDNINYFIGKKIGPQIFSREDSRLFNRKHLDKTKLFYAKYGARAVVLGRFMPIARTFVPFVAGIGNMKYGKYVGMSLFGSLLWINLFTWAGHLFGNLPAVKTNFHVVIFGVIGVSLLPMIYEVLQARRKSPEVSR